MPGKDDEFKFPDEIEDKKVENKEDDDLEIEIEDDTPEPDKNKPPLPPEVVEELYNDELEDYSAKVKKKLIQMKKLAHDERRAKEALEREHNEAVTLARKLIEENNKLKSNLNTSEKHFIESVKKTAEMELKDAEKEYQEAYESGDSAKVLAAQKKLNQATLRMDKVSNFRPAPLQEEKIEVQTPPSTPQIKVDPKAQAWQQQNSWFGEDEEMTSLALGLHEKLKKEGVAISSQEYYRRIDETMRKRFPERFEAEEADTEEQKPAPTKATKPSTVVAPATRSTSSKKVRLTQSQIALAKKFGLTPEQYAQELLKMEA